MSHTMGATSMHMRCIRLKVLWHCMQETVAQPTSTTVAAQSDAEGGAEGSGAAVPPLIVVALAPGAVLSKWAELANAALAMFLTGQETGRALAVGTLFRG